MLDYVKLLPQMQALTAERQRAVPLQAAMLRRAVEALHQADPDWQHAAQRLDSARTSWLVATLHEPLPMRYPLPSRPDAYTALATDGSQIAPDRHEAAFCYLLNIGLVSLRYGEEAEARLDSQPTLAFADDEMFEDFQGEKLGVTGKRLAARRVLMECDALAGMITEQAGRDIPALALLDSPLIFWWFESDTPEYRRRVIGQYQKLLDTGRRHGVPIAGYNSLPGSRDVVNALRLLRCPHEDVNCDRLCPSPGDTLRRNAPCAGIEEVTDAELFRLFLQPGERSALFGSRSSILSLYAPENQILFFYLHAGEEVARIEIPRWVAETPGLLDRVHALTYDQAGKGGGYPRALTEAHERAVVRGADRDAFFRMLETSFARHRLPVRVTRKALAKRARSV